MFFNRCCKGGAALIKIQTTTYTNAMAYINLAFIWTTNSRYNNN